MLWNETHVVVRCPFCRWTHKHEFTGRCEGEAKLAHFWEKSVPRNQHYLLRFPFQVSGVSFDFEIDKKRMVFVTHGTAAEDLPAYDLTADLKP